jgi:putative phosphoribosyl transferase
MLFEDRFEAGQFLAEKLSHYRDQPDVIVLALPRGGVPVGFEVARALGAPLDVFLVRKLGLPGQPELAMGAIADGGVQVLHDELVEQLQISEEAIEQVAAEEREELRRQEAVFRQGRAPPNVTGRTVILVDDGLATGSTMRAAVAALKVQRPKRIVMAVPVGAEETCAEFTHEVDEAVCVAHPEDFRSVGVWYRDFSPVSDREVNVLLTEAERHRRAPLSTPAGSDFSGTEADYLERQS